MWSNDEMKSSVSQHICDIAILYVHKVTWIWTLAPSDEMREINMQRNTLFVYVCVFVSKWVCVCVCVCYNRERKYKFKK